MAIVFKTTCKLQSTYDMVKECIKSNQASDGTHDIRISIDIKAKYYIKHFLHISIYIGSSNMTEGQHVASIKRGIAEAPSFI